MQARFLILAAVVVLCGIGSARATEQNGDGPDRAKLIGAWHIISMEEQGPDGKLEHHTERTGMLVFT